ncbi:hypothetical protein Ciccas_003730 [Cichlidogyrus casuarinus]|uniref:MAM domain-containing protein n=1 Tax=Cichlidogyrus casuarinus TaxID=1844966 RepID=A0ABD2QFT0_9PLAT
MKSPFSDNELVWHSAISPLSSSWQQVSIKLDQGVEDYKISLKFSINTQLVPLTVPLFAFSSRDCRTIYDKESNLPSTLCSNQPLWNSDKAASKWTRVDLNLPAKSKDFKLILEGSIPAGYPDAKICVDNITTYTEPCSG